jgi:hypothetical protein
MRGKLAAAVLGLGLTSSSFGALLVDFKPDPISPSLNEVGWDGTNLLQGPGSVGNADGTKPSGEQTPGGLFIQTPFMIVGVPGSALNDADKSTSFFDVTLELGGLGASNPANRNQIIPGLVIVSQPIGEGRFALYSTDPDGPNEPLLPTLLLAGAIRDMVVVGIENQPTGSVQSTTVTYDDGLIYDKLVEYHGDEHGSLSWSLLDITPGLFAAEGENLRAFAANMTGLFSTPAIPEPTTLSILGLSALLLVQRCRSRKA